MDWTGEFTYIGRIDLGIQKEDLDTSRGAGRILNSWAEWIDG